METPSPPSVQVSQQLSQMTRWMEAQERCTHELSERVLAMDERSVQALGEISGQLARLEAALHTDINSRAGGVVLHHGAAAGAGGGGGGGLGHADAPPPSSPSSPTPAPQPPGLELSAYSLPPLDKAPSLAASRQQP
jgi:hypothetical protein